MHDLIPVFQQYLINYGDIALFVLLAVGIVGLPIPDETLMTIAGFLIFQGKLTPISTFIAAVAGSILGITLSFWLGKTAGHFLLKKYGRYIRVTEAKLEKVHRWFEKIGKWALFFGYFIPGVRHFTGYTAGTVRLEYRTFAIFAYAGAMIWVITFLSLGYFVGTQWETIIEKLDDQILIYLIIGIVLAVAGIFIFQKLRRRARLKAEINPIN